MNKWVVGVKTLFRLRPVAAWGLGDVLLGISVAVYKTGWDLNWSLLGIATVFVIIIQAMLAHTLNDIVDYEVDKRAPIEKTGRSKVLLNGVLTRPDLKLFGCVILIISLALLFILIYFLDLNILFLAAVGFYAAIAYNLPPLRLGWRPFAEWTVVLPTLTTLVIGVAYVATGQFFWLAFVVGIFHSLINIPFFLTSRMMDVEADREVGKITTLVKYPNINWNMFVYSIHFILFLLLLGYFGLERTFSWLIFAFFISYIISLFIAAVGSIKNNYSDKKRLANKRALQIYLGIGHACVLSVFLILTG